MRISRFLPVVVLALVAAVVTAFSLTACTGKAASAGIAPPVAPVTVDLSTPQASVRTYLQFTSFAYRMANSDLATAAMTPDEGVRVDSYVQLNREKDRGIEQQLLSFTERGVSQEGTRTLVAAAEKWRYRYFSLSKLTYLSPSYDASYDATYTVVRQATGWLVDKVEAQPRGTVK